jgi:hypothetical protein
VQKNIGLIIFLLLTAGIAFSQTFEIDQTNYFLYMLGISTIELSNNYFDRQLTDKLTPDEIAELDANDIPSFDRWINLDPDPDVKDWSDYAIYFTLGASVVTVYDEDYLWDNLMILTKILMTQSALCKWTKTLILRERPYLYSTENTVNSRQSRHSFYSSHVSTAFSSAVFAYYYYVDNYGGNIPVASLLFGGATATAVLRSASAQHFPSDVLTGAVMGSAVSYLICRYHHSDRVKYNFGFNSLGIEISF